MSGSNHSSKDLDVTNCSRGVWLVKVPKYMRQKWSENSGSIDVGKLKIAKCPGKVPTVTFSLNDSMASTNKLPKEHKFVLHSVKEQTLGVFSQATSSGEGNGAEAEQVYLEGQVVQKFECQPVVDINYLNLKRKAVKDAAVPDKQAKMLHRPAIAFKPISQHAHDVANELRKKTEGKKARDDKDKVLEVLYAAFERHQYYNIKDLQKITRQPITYLKEILKEFCDYNVKNPHKNMWELKPEYRHYKEEKPATDSASE